MEEAPISISHGPLRSLPAKLEQILSPDSDHGLREPDKNKIRLLKGSLQQLIDKYLVEPSEVEYPASMAKCWVKEVRELSYDIEDFLDELIPDGVPKNYCGWTGTIGKGWSRRNRWVADNVSQLRTRLEGAIQRHKDYNLDKCKMRESGITSAERPLPPLYRGVPKSHVNSSLEKKLEEQLTGGGNNLTVVSIVGFGGVGKTTLARELYCKLGLRFECRAFVRLSQKPDMGRLLTSLLLQVRPHRPPEASESRNLVNTIKAHLQHKKYLIVIDGIWAPSTWDIIRHSLPEDKCCSRVLITTEVDIVAHRCSGYNSDHVFNIGPLSDEESRELFFSRLSGNQSESHDRLNDVSSEIVKKCGGCPLAIVTTASLLARQQNWIEKYNYMMTSVSPNSWINPTMEGVTQGFCLCYNNIPDHLKACMLYFSVYKEDHVIWKYDLVKQWIAEGFICAKGDVEKVASGYFDELVEMGMVQPVDVKHNGEVLSCTVHYMVLHYIRYKCIKENFITAIDHSQTNIELADTVRRLSLHYGDAADAEPPAKLNLSQVRSFFFFGLLRCLPSLEEFRLVRVMILHLWSDQDSTNFDLTTLCKLFGLRYLEIACNAILNLQSRLQGLQHLETLKIDSRVNEVPQDIFHLPGLLHLSLPVDTNPMTLLHSPSSNSSLQDLRLTFSTIPCNKLEENMEKLALVLSKLEKLKYLTLSFSCSSKANTLETSRNNISCDGLSNVSSPPRLIERLHLSPRFCIFSSLPMWIGELGNLCILKIAVRQLSSDNVGILKRLCALAALSLYVQTAPEGRIIFDDKGFPVLKYFKFICTSACVGFMEGAMPNVRRLKLGFDAKTMHHYRLIDAGFQHLTGLEDISAKISCVDAQNQRKVAYSALDAAFSPRIVNIQWVDPIFVGTEAQRTKNENLGKSNVITYEGLDENYEISVEGSSEQTQRPSRITTSLESSSHVQGSGKDSDGHYGIGEKGSKEHTQRPADSRFTVSSLKSSSHVKSSEKDSDGEKGSREHTQRPTDRRITMSLESSSNVQSSGMVSTKVANIIRLLRLSKANKLLVESELTSLNREKNMMVTIIKEKTKNSPGPLLERLILELEDLVYDIEDFTDVYNQMMLVISSKRTSHSKRVRWRARTLGHLRYIAPLKQRLSSSWKWQQSAISTHGGGTGSSCPSGGFVPHYYVPQGEVVGMDEPIRELVELLLDSTSERYKVISLLGCRGVGKTTLAGAIYENAGFEPAFDLHIWVMASGCNTGTDLLHRIIQACSDHRPDQSVSCFYLMDKLRCLLSSKRCLVVIDDLQRSEIWYDVEGALAEIFNGGYRQDHPGSRIVLTTSIQSVAVACCPERSIYRMEGLDSSKSKDLFWSKLCSRTNRTSAVDCALEDILRKCDGLPLALVGAANYIRAKGQNLHQFELEPGAFKGVNTVLMQCYDSLPDYSHRVCLLSLSLFPKGHCINRKSLIRTWTAEGLVKADGSRSAEQVGGDCFDELVDRNLIEPVLVGNNFKVKRFRVRGVMLEAIINKAVSITFITLIHEDELLHNKEGSHPIRRLCVQGSTAESARVAAAVGLKHVRWLTVHDSEPFRQFQSCRLVRVLHLEGCKGVDECTLHWICKLTLLRYLSLRGSDVSCIPKKIKKLEFLETLDIRETQVHKLPMEVIMLPRLVHLFGQIELPQELGDENRRSKLQAFFSEQCVLQTLSGFVMDGNCSCELILLHMRFLKKVKIWCKQSITSSENLASSLQKCFSKDNGPESLSIDFGDQSMDFLDSVLLEGPCKLSSIKLRGSLTRLPNFFTLLNTISELQLSFTGLSIEDLSVMQDNFPQLLCLKLVEGPRAFWGGCFVVRKGGFPNLQRLCFEAPELPKVHIDEGGMSSVSSLHLLCSKYAFCHKFSGIDHLKYLNEVVLHPSVGDEELETWKQEARGHQNRPKVYRHPTSA